MKGYGSNVNVGIKVRTGSELIEREKESEE